MYVLSLPTNPVGSLALPIVINYRVTVLLLLPVLSLAPEEYTATVLLPERILHLLMRSMASFPMKVFLSLYLSSKWLAQKCKIKNVRLVAHCLYVLFWYGTGISVSMYRNLGEPSVSRMSRPCLFEFENRMSQSVESINILALPQLETCHSPVGHPMRATVKSISTWAIAMQAVAN